MSATETQGEQQTASTHMPQLDTLRSVAALIVVWQHTAAPHFMRIGRDGLGIYGVWFFFVLSGFLITGILLRETGREGGSWSLAATLRAFYARRFLRIFPAYYLLLAVGATFAISASFRDDWPWHVAYLTNWLVAWRARFGGAAGPLWSLGVEEQFYLVWPVLVLTAPRRLLPYLFASAAAFGIVSRVLLVLMGLNGGSTVSVVTPTPSNLDPLAIGALLAWAHHGRLTREATIRATRYALAAGSALFGFVVLSSLHVVDRGWRAVPVVETLCAALISVWIIDRAARGVSSASLVGRVLDAAPLRYLGAISYGIYLWHDLVKSVITAHLPAAAQPFLETASGGVVLFAVVLVATVGVASVSWFAYERPINSLKRRFPYPRPVPAPAPADAPSEVVDPALASA